MVVLNKGAIIVGIISTFLTRRAYGQLGADCSADPTLCDGYANGQCISAVNLCACLAGYSADGSGGCFYNCGAQPAPTNGAVSTRPNNLENAVATYSCNAGFILTGIKQRTCVILTGWSGAAPTCVADCGPPPAPANGFVSTAPNNLENAVATYSCNAGFTLTGITNRTCVTLTGWSGAAPTCVAGCGYLPAPANGIVSTAPNNLENGVATYSCNAGFILTGITKRTCVILTGWSSAAPTCVAVKLGDSCAIDASLCNNIANGTCSGGVCVCYFGYFDTGTGFSCQRVVYTSEFLEISATSVRVSFILYGPAKTNYSILLNADPPAESKTLAFEDDGTVEFSVNGLEEYWNYTITVKVTTFVDELILEPTKAFKTKPSAPGKVEDFHIATSPGFDYNKVHILWKIPSILNRNSLIVTYKLSEKGNDLAVSIRTIQAEFEQNTYKETVDVVPGQVYTFEVYAVNNEGDSGEKTTQTIQAPTASISNDVVDSGIIVGVVMGSVIFILIVVIIIGIVWLIRTQRLSSTGSSETGDTLPMESLGHTLPAHQSSSVPTLQPEVIHLPQTVATNVSRSDEVTEGQYMELDESSRIQHNLYLNLDTGTQLSEYENPEYPQRNRGTGSEQQGGRNHYQNIQSGRI